MAKCTFFGHSDCDNSIKRSLIDKIHYLIEVENVNVFYVGNNGFYDHLVISVLEEIEKNKDIKFFVVLSQMPSGNNYFVENCYNTILPEGIENVFPKFAVIYRNKWMIDRSDFVVTYVNRPYGGAAKFYELAIKKGKTVFNLGKYKS